MVRSVQDVSGSVRNEIKAIRQSLTVMESSVDNALDEVLKEYDQVLTFIKGIKTTSEKELREITSADIDPLETLITEMCERLDNLNKQLHMSTEAQIDNTSLFPRGKERVKSMKNLKATLITDLTKLIDKIIGINQEHAMSPLVQLISDIRQTNLFHPTSSPTPATETPPAQQARDALDAKNLQTPEGTVNITPDPNLTSPAAAATAASHKSTTPPPAASKPPPTSAKQSATEPSSVSPQETVQTPAKSSSDDRHWYNLSDLDLTPYRVFCPKQPPLKELIQDNPKTYTGPDGNVVETPTGTLKGLCILPYLNQDKVIEFTRFPPLFVDLYGKGPLHKQPCSMFLFKVIGSDGKKRYYVQWQLSESGYFIPPNAASNDTLLKLIGFTRSVSSQKQATVSEKKITSVPKQVSAPQLVKETKTSALRQSVVSSETAKQFRGGTLRPSQKFADALDGKGGRSTTTSRPLQPVSRGKLNSMTNFIVSNTQT
jgi:hypothetical protein